MPPDLRRKTISLVAIAIALCVPVVAAADDGVKETSRSTFTLRPDAGTVHAGIKITLVNQRRSPLRRWASIWSPVLAENVDIRGKGVSLETVSNGTGVNDTVDLRPLPRKGRQRILVDYDLVDEPLAIRPPTRVTPSYAHFCWGGQSTDSGTTEAILPAGWQAITTMEDVVTDRTADRVVLRSASNHAPGDFYACTDAFERRPGTGTITIGPSGQVIRLEAWSDDPAWEAAFSLSIAQGLSDLEQLVGAPLPYPELTIQEAARPVPLARDDDFLPDQALLLVDERVGIPGVATVALARTWFSRDAVSDAWLRNGLAWWTGLTATGLDCPDPGPLPDGGTAHLADWQVRDGRPDTWNEQLYWFQDASACAIVDTVANAIGSEAMTSVIGTLLEAPEPVDWTTWLAAIDAVTPSPGASTTAETPVELASRLLLEYGIVSPDDLSQAGAASL